MLKLDLKTVEDEGLRVVHFGNSQILLFGYKTKKKQFQYSWNKVPTHMLSSGSEVDILFTEDSGKEFLLKDKFPYVLGCYKNPDLSEKPRTVFRFSYDVIYSFYIEKQKLNEKLQNPSISIQEKEAIIKLREELMFPKKKKPLFVEDHVIEILFS